MIVYFFNLFSGFNSDVCLLYRMIILIILKESAIF